MNFILGILVILYALLNKTITYSSTLPSYDKALEDAKEISDFIVEKRRLIHQNAELAFEEFETSKIIKQALTEIGANYTGNWGINTHDFKKEGTGIVAQFGTGHGPCVGLRADIDALALQEPDTFEFKSRSNGKMHACGHDSHAAMLLGTAKLFKKYEHLIPGTVKLVFQPAEEDGGGGAMITREGFLSQYPPIENMFGIHINSLLPTGEVTSASGPITAGVDDFKVTISGKGGHGALPHLSIDPITAASEAIRSIYDVYARELYFQFDTAGVISVTYANAGGGALNVIPDTMVFGGTIRSFSSSVLSNLRDRITTISKEVAEAYRCTAEVEFTLEPYPPTYNDPSLYQFLLDIASKTKSIGTISEAQPMMGAEDFSFYAEQVPSLFMFLGTGSGSEIAGHPPTNHSAHSPLFAIDERSLPIGSALNFYISTQRLNYLAQKEKGSQYSEL